MSHFRVVQRALWSVCRSLMLGFILSLVLTTSLSSAQCNNPTDCTLCTSSKFICAGLTNLPVPASNDIAQSVEEISLTGGTISSIPAGYFNFPELTTLNLSSNALSTLPVESFELTTLLETIDLTDNPIVCNSDIDWLQKWLFSFAFNSVFGDCTSGTSISGYLDAQGDVQIADVYFGDVAVSVGRNCLGTATLTIRLTSPISEDITYAIINEPLGVASANDITINPMEITFAAGETSADVSIRINNGGTAGEEKEYLLYARPKLPITYEGNLKLILIDGEVCNTPTIPPVVPASSGPTAPPVTPTSPSLIKTSTDGCGSTTCPKLSCSKNLQKKGTCCLECMDPHGIPGWLIFLIVLLVICLIGLICLAVFCIIKKCCASKPAVESATVTTDHMKVHYSPVGPQAKVYNDTTEDL